MTTSTLAAAFAQAEAFVSARRGWSGGHTMTAGATLDRLADQAVAARGGADLYRFQLADRIPDAAFKSNSDGTVTVTGVELLKTGQFNGLNVGDADLLAMVAYFRELRDAGIFVPPFRLDHSWSVMSVIGYFAELDTARRTDDTDGVDRLFLTGDIVVTGSLDYTPAQIVDAIKRGALRLRSSELGYYVTNAGREIPLAYYGCAFVDIPAVEGLAPVKLSSRRADPHSITVLNATTEETSAMDPIKLARLKALRALVKAGTTLSDAGSEELAGLETEASAADVDDVAVEAAGDVPESELVDAVATGTPAGGEGEGSSDPDPDAADPNADAGRQPGTAGQDPAAPPADPAGQPAADSIEGQLAQAQRQIAELRREREDREIAELRASGAIVEAYATEAESLLRHSDESVRRSAGAILSAIPGRVKLTRRPGRTSLSHETGQNAGQVAAGSLNLRSMSGEDGGALWASLSSEERREHQAEYDEWIAYRQENSIRD